jgi:two-component system chemotaxis response regulator CheY
MANRILIVDDSSSFRQVVGLALQREGYEVVEACDGVDALSKLDGNKFDLIISDVNMPNMDGITFVSKAKEIPAYKFTPVCMLTTESGDDMKQRGRAAGAKAWVVKPFEPPVLLKAVSKLLM